MLHGLYGMLFSVWLWIVIAIVCYFWFEVIRANCRERVNSAREMAPDRETK
jgi:hypothetical protein